MIRIGFLWEKIIDLDNCIEEVKEMLKNKKHNKHLDRGYTLIRKGQMYRISHKARHFNDKKINLSKARSFMDSKGLLKH